MVVWNWTVNRKFGSYYDFYLSIVSSLVINECTCHNYQVTNNGDLISFEVAYLIFNIMS
jgi:hypothetical protein